MSRAYAILRCLACATPDAPGPILVPSPLIAHGPREHERHEQIAGISYDYRCPTCGYAENHAHRPEARGA